MKGKYSLVHTFTNIGHNVIPIRVEVYLRRGIPGYQVIGLPTRNIRESKDRIRAGIESSGFEFPFQNITINLSPTNTKKDGAHFDLTIAVGILIASEQLDFKMFNDSIFIGELGLNGDIQPTQNLAKLLAGFQKKETTLFLPKSNLTEAEMYSNNRIYGIESLGQLKNLNDVMTILPSEKNSHRWEIANNLFSETNLEIKTKNDFIHLYSGQILGFESLVFGLMGNHHILFTGSPGSGKTMLAEISNQIQSLPNQEEWKEIYSIYQNHEGIDPFQPHRPFRMPHHSITANGLLGGGINLQYGELSLAHRGILVLDEFGEIKSNLIQNLREPMEKGRISIHRNSQWAEFPALFLLIAITNLCPCGNFSSGELMCICRKEQIRSYLSKISGPILERLDIIVEIHKNQLTNINTKTFNLTEIKSKIQTVRQLQWERYKGTNIMNNSEIPSNLIFHYLEWNETDCKNWDNNPDYNFYSFREKEKILKLARTIADSQFKSKVEQDDVSIALGFREGSKTIRNISA
jgi:magnesium chelatase family protein